MKLKPEDILQIQICEWVKQLHPEIPIIGVMNQRKCSLVYGFILKKMGLRKGASDLMFPKGNGDKPGIWLEIKTFDGKASKEQIKFRDDMRALGYEAQITYGFDEAIHIISSFYGFS